MYTRDGDNHLTPAAAAAGPKATQDVPAPLTPPDFINAVVSPDRLPGFQVLSLYPNPASSLSQLHYGLNERTDLVITLLDANGRLVRELERSTKPAGLYTLATNLDGLPSGTYFYRIQSSRGLTTQAFIKQ